jgi:hypothetical protein
MAAHRSGGKERHSSGLGFDDLLPNSRVVPVELHLPGSQHGGMGSIRSPQGFLTVLTSHPQIGEARVHRAGFSHQPIANPFRSGKRIKTRGRRSNRTQCLSSYVGQLAHHPSANFRNKGSAELLRHQPFTPPAQASVGMSRGEINLIPTKPWPNCEIADHTLSHLAGYDQQIGSDEHHPLFPDLHRKRLGP